MYLRKLIIAVIDQENGAQRLLQAAQRRAERSNMDLEMLVLETPRLSRLFHRKEDAEEIIETDLTLLAKETASSAVITSHKCLNVVEGICEIVTARKAEGRQVYMVKVASHHSVYSRWMPWKRGIAEQLKGRRELQDITISSLAVAPDMDMQVQLTSIFNNIIKDSVLGAAMALFTTFIIQVATEVVPELFAAHGRNKIMIYFIGCMFAANRGGFTTGISASIVSFLLLTSVLTETTGFSFSNPADSLSLVLFILSGILVSAVTSRDYDRRQFLARRAKRFHSLLKIHRLALSKSSREETIAALDTELKSFFGTEVVFLLPNAINNNMLETFYRKDETYFRKDITLNDADRYALNICWEECKAAGVGTTLGGTECAWRFEPLVTMQGELGVLGVLVENRIQVDLDFAKLLSGISEQVALILEHLELEENMENSRLHSEREKLRVMLLSSVSHDLKTPLASVIGSLSVYKTMRERLPENHRQTLINTALEEAQRLDSFITNILDMTRIESGQIQLKPEWADPCNVVDGVVRRLRERLLSHPLEVKMQSSHKGGHEVWMDVMMTGQVLQNLLDNAAKYTAAGTAVEVYSETDDAGYRICVRDHGNGIPEAKLEAVFDKYSRLKKQDSQVAGTGLGLAIARAIMHAQGGSIVATNHPDGGAVFTLHFPQWRNAVLAKEA